MGIGSEGFLRPVSAWIELKFNRITAGQLEGVRRLAMPNHGPLR